MPGGTASDPSCIGWWLSSLPEQWEVHLADDLDEDVVGYGRKSTGHELVAERSDGDGGESRMEHLREDLTRATARPRTVSQVAAKASVDSPAS